MLIGHQPKEFLLAVEGLTVSFDGFKAVNDLSFYVEENEIRVIIGPNGAGKTTVLDLICGKTKATSGSIQFRGKELTKLKGELRAVKHRTAFDRAARAAKVPDAHLDDLWELSKLDTSADAPDDAAITKVLDEQKTKRPIYFADAQSTSSITAETVEAAAKPAPGSGRGQPLPAGQQAFFQVRSKDLNDPKWRIANDAKLHKAFEDGNVRIIAD